MFERKNGFYERYGTGGDVEMSTVVFRGADRAKSLAIGRRTKRLVNPLISIGSPSGVAVPWHSI